MDPILLTNTKKRYLRLFETCPLLRHAIFRNCCLKEYICKKKYQGPIVDKNVNVVQYLMNYDKRNTLVIKL